MTTSLTILPSMSNSVSQPTQRTAKLLFNVTAIVTTDLDLLEINHNDLDVPGTYSEVMELPSEEDLAQERMLDWFHDSVAIKVLDDFDIQFVKAQIDEQIAELGGN
jgi:hypothetical protein